MGRINQYPKASAINGNDTLLGVVGGTTKQVAKDVLLSGVTNDISNTTIVGKKAGKLVTAEDSSNNRLPEITAYGKSTQNTYSGKNLAESFVNATYTTQWQPCFFVMAELKPSTEYTISFDTTVANDIYVNENLSKTSVGIITKNGRNIVTFTTLDNLEKNSTNYNESNGWIIFKNYIAQSQALDASNVQLELGAEATNYEPYVGGEASPSPSFPQAITSVADDKSLVVKSCGRNVATYENNLASNSDNELFYNNTVAGGVAKVNGNEKWYIHCNNHSLLNGGFVRLFFTKEYPKVGVSVVSRLNISKNEVITIPEDAEYLVICALSTEVTLEKSISALAEIMVAKSDVAIPYEPYVSTEASITLTDSLRGIPVTEGGNYVDENGQQWICDTVEKYADGTGMWTKRVYSEPITDVERVGNSYIQYGAEAIIYLSRNIRKVDTEAVIMSNKALGVPYNKRGSMVGGQDDVYRVYCTELDYVTFRYPASVGEITLEQAKTDLVGGEIVYALAEPIETDLTAEELAELEKLQTFEPCTTVMTDDTGDIAIKYFKNTDSGYIVGSLNDRISNLVALLQSNGVI